MTTQDKEAVEAADRFARKEASPEIRSMFSASRTVLCIMLKETFLAGISWQKQREKPVNGELEGDD